MKNELFEEKKMKFRKKNWHFVGGKKWVMQQVLNMQ